MLLLLVRISRNSHHLIKIKYIIKLKLPSPLVREAEHQREHTQQEGCQLDTEKCHIQHTGELEEQGRDPSENATVVHTKRTL